jgi:hypothetical protein
VESETQQWRHRVLPQFQCPHALSLGFQPQTVKVERFSPVYSAHAARRAPSAPHPFTIHSTIIVFPKKESVAYLSAEMELANSKVSPFSCTAQLVGMK